MQGLPARCAGRLYRQLVPTFVLNLSGMDGDVDAEEMLTKIVGLENDVEAIIADLKNHLQERASIDTLLISMKRNFIFTFLIILVTYWFPVLANHPLAPQSEVAVVSPTDQTRSGEYLASTLPARKHW